MNTKFGCGCIIQQSNNLAVQGMERCPLHTSAPELLETLKEIQDFWRGGDCPEELQRKMNAAIAKAEGGTK